MTLTERLAKITETLFDESTTVGECNSALQALAEYNTMLDTMFPRLDNEDERAIAPTVQAKSFKAFRTQAGEAFLGKL